MLALLLVVTISVSLGNGLRFAAAVEGDTAQVSPGKILPEGYNHYLATPEVQVKLEFSRALVLQETTGDLLFNITTLAPRRTIAIYIPNEFGLQSNLEYVWTSVTNDYRFISLSKLGDRDAIAPNWWRVLVSNGTSIVPGSYFVKVFNVTAPSIVGRYFFKIFTDGTSIGAENFPTLVVSADPNPAYIDGTVRDGGSDSAYYGQPVRLADSEGGRVVAEGITTDGRIVVAQAFFNSSAAGQYTLYGLAPGTYRLTASAAGYHNTTRSELVEVTAGQSLSLDLYVIPSPIFRGIVWSKCNGLLEPWGALSTQVGPGAGAALVYVGTGAFPGKDLIYGLRGAGTPGFLRFDTIAGNWEAMQSVPGSVGAGGSLAYDGVQYIYAFQGAGSDAFRSHDVAGNSWQSLTVSPAPVGDGAALAFNANDGAVYALRGSGTQDFWRYLPQTNTWEILAGTPAAVDAGGSLVFNPNDGLLYALRGSGTMDFWSYDQQTNTWTTLASTPLTVSSGGSLAFRQQDGFIYALRGGGTTDLMVYNPGANTWAPPPPLASIPSVVNSGGSLVADNSNGLLYAIVGGGSEQFFSYNAAPTNAWSSEPDIPFVVPRPIAIEILDLFNQTVRLLENFTDPASSSYRFLFDGTIELDGHIPQVGAGYVGGITPGFYYVDVWVNQYVQPADVKVPLTTEEGDFTVNIDLLRSGRVEVLIHFKDFAYQLESSPVGFDRTLSVALYDHDEVVRGQNSTRVSASNSSIVVVVTGLSGTRGYGLPDDTYEVVVTIDGYYQPVETYVTVAGCNSIAKISLDMIRTGSLILTLYSVNWQVPPQPENWRYPGSSIRVEIRDVYGVEIEKTLLTRQQPFRSSLQANMTGLRTDTYSIYVFTFGYIQSTSYVISMTDGFATDVAVNLVLGGVLELTVVIEKEHILSTIDTYPYSQRVPVRVEVYDALYQFVAANATYVTAESTTFTLRLMGFRSYAGNAAHRWVNYYDTTDGSLQRDYGLGSGSYTFLVYVPGYLQASTEIVAALSAGGESSVILHLDRLAHVLGDVKSFNMYDELVPLNWATVDALGEMMSDYTFTLDGRYDLWLEEGTYLVIYSLNGYEAAVRSVVLPNGSDVPIEQYLPQIGIPLPELPSTNVAVFASMLIALVLLAVVRRQEESDSRVTTRESI